MPKTPSSLWDVSHFAGNKKHLAISMAPSYTHLLGLPNIATDHFRFLILHQPADWIGECRLANVTNQGPTWFVPTWRCSDDGPRMADHLKGLPVSNLLTAFVMDHSVVTVLTIVWQTFASPPIDSEELQLELGTHSLLEPLGVKESKNR